MSNLRIKAIQYNTEELYPALDSLSNGFNIVYSNLKSSINLNGMRLKSRKFDTMLYNEEDNIIILLMRGGVLSKEDIIEYLEIYKKPYALVTFEKNIYEYKDDKEISEFVFVNNKKELCEELTKCLYNSLDNCKYYNLLNGTFDLGYMSKFSQRFSIDKSSYKGALKFNNKIILLSNEFNLTEDIIKNILKTFQINYEIDENIQADIYTDINEDKVKNLKLERFEYFK